MHELIKGGEATAASKPNNELSNVVVAAAEDALLFPHEDDIEAGLRNAPNTPQEKEEAPAAHGPRLVSLDVFRGFTVAVTFIPGMRTGSDVELQCSTEATFSMLAERLRKYYTLLFRCSCCATATREPCWSPR
ncbi:hypothetical protein BHE74_00051085 [Ensete ventricosum]|nr:hypothetical protein BHE74_00051085 [Ensete ventricosum]